MRLKSEGDDGCVDNVSLFGLEIGEKCWIEVEWEVEVQKSGRQTQQVQSDGCSCRRCNSWRLWLSVEGCATVTMGGMLKV